MQTRSLNGLDVQILRFLNRFAVARKHHITAWTGAAPATINARMTVLKRAGLVASREVPVQLRSPASGIVDSRCVVWETTAGGARAAGAWHVPGTQEWLSMDRAGRGGATIDHALGVTDLACWYRMHGFEVAAEREIRSLEQASVLAPAKTLPVWGVPSSLTEIMRRDGLHFPDLGAIDADGRKWAVELERAVKDVGEYAGVIAAYRQRRLGQVWHVLRQPTMRRLRDAGTQVGIEWDPASPPTVLMSTDASVRLMMWVPGRAHVTKLTDFKRQINYQRAPAGFPTPDPLPDLAASWRRGRPIDVDAADFDPEHCGRTVTYSVPAAREVEEAVR